MNPKLILARWIAGRIEARTRRQRRALRDCHRHEITRIRSGEKRSRGLRLYVAWSRRERIDNTRANHAGNWHKSPLPQAA